MKRLFLVMMIALMLIIPRAFSQGVSKNAVKLPPTDLNRIKVGEPAPDFTLENYDGNKITLSDFRGKKNVLLVFYRGHW
jgi:cytochrome oxidase Cu insertion factor (SCO1/SenC/PrrC family)